MGQAGAGGRLLETLCSHRTELLRQDGEHRNRGDNRAEAILQLGDKGPAIHATVSVTQGWCGSADPRKRQYETKHSEADEMRKEIEEIKVKTEVEHKDIMSGEGIELVPLMKDKHTGEQRNISTVTVDM